MKKVLSVILALCLMVGLCGCESAPIKVKKFASEAEMQTYVQGVWIDTWSDELIFFDNGIAFRWETVSGRLTDFENTFEPFIEEQGYKAFSEMNVSDRIAELEKEWHHADEGLTCQFNPNKGELSIGGADYKVYVGEDVLYDGSSGGEYEKLSDTPSYTAPGLIEKFEEALKNYTPKATAPAEKALSYDAIEKTVDTLMKTKYTGYTGITNKTTTPHDDGTVSHSFKYFDDLFSVTVDVKEDAVIKLYVLADPNELAEINDNPYGVFLLVSSFPALPFYDESKWDYGENHTALANLACVEENETTPAENCLSYSAEIDTWKYVAQCTPLVCTLFVGSAAEE